MEVCLNPFLTFILGADGWSTSGPDRLTPGQSAAFTCVFSWELGGTEIRSGRFGEAKPVF